MVDGIEKFRAHFAGQHDQYVLIGGAACDLIFNEAGLPFRATKDFDIVLCAEVIGSEFAGALLSFLEEGGYQVWANSDGEKKFFRFERPANPEFPKMLEVFARPPAVLDLPIDDRYVRLTVEDNILSLSALLLDDVYFEALKTGSTDVEGVNVLNANLLIPFKAKAYIDLVVRKERGESVKSVDIKKHRADVFRLMQLLPGNASLDMPEAIKRDLKAFVALVEPEETFDPKAHGLPGTREEGLKRLANVYNL